MAISGCCICIFGIERESYDSWEDIVVSVMWSYSPVSSNLWRGGLKKQKKR